MRILLFAIAVALAIPNNANAQDSSESTPIEQANSPEFTSQSTHQDQVIAITSDGKVQDLPYTIGPNDNAVVQGDIVIGTANEIEELKSAGAPVSQESLFRIGKGLLWPKGIVPYSFAADFASKETVQKAINHWQEKTSIKFIPASASTSDYIHFVNSDDCSTKSGMQGGEQRIYLSEACGFGAAVHEIGHVLGLGHEQMRSDRDKYVTFILENVTPGMESQFSIAAWKYADTNEYCYESIMHYPRWAFGKKTADGKRVLHTLIPKDPNVRIGQRSGLAACDITTVQQKYASEFSKR